MNQNFRQSEVWGFGGDSNFDWNDKTQINSNNYYATLHLKPRDYKRPWVLRDLYENLV